MYLHRYDISRHSSLAYKAVWQIIFGDDTQMAQFPVSVKSFRKFESRKAFVSAKVGFPPPESFYLATELGEGRYGSEEVYRSIQCQWQFTPAIARLQETTRHRRVSMFKYTLLHSKVGWEVGSSY